MDRTTSGEKHVWTLCDQLNNIFAETVWKNLPHGQNNIRRETCVGSLRPIEELLTGIRFLNTSQKQKAPAWHTTTKKSKMSKSKTKSIVTEKFLK
ncbi:hypothetical protein Trydic_g7997 [Trypoxylus dichotomus]